MLIAELQVEGGTKLNEEHGAKIRSRLAGKKLQVKLDAADLNDKLAVTNPRNVAAEILTALREEAPLLAHAKELVFRKAVRSAAPHKLLVQIDRTPAFPCTLLLQADTPAAPPRDAAGAMTIPSLYSKETFSALLTIRFCRAEIGYTINHPDSAALVKKAYPSLDQVRSRTLAEVDAALAKTVAALQKGLAAQGSAAMSWKEAKKLVDQLNKEVQRVINTVADQANAAMNKALASISPGTKAACSVTAMFSKFEILGSVYFAGAKPSANEKSIKPLKGAVTKLHTVAERLDTALAKLVKATDSFCTMVRKAQQADKAAQATKEPDAPPARAKPGADAEPPAPTKDDVRALAARIGEGQEKRLAALQAIIEQTGDLLETEYKQAGTLSEMVGKVRKTHDQEKKGEGSAKGKKDSQALTRELELFRKQVDRFETTLTEAMRLCDTLQTQAQVPGCYGPAGTRKIQESADTLEQKRFAAITARLVKMCDSATDLIAD